MFNSTQLEKHKKELFIAKEARKSRAAFGSIIRRNIKEFCYMSISNQIAWLCYMDLPESYTTEISKEISVHNYNEKMISKDRVGESMKI